MSRQILVDLVETDFQRILWLPISESSLQQFRLLIIMYGPASAPYFAMNVLKQLAIDDRDRVTHFRSLF